MIIGADPGAGQGDTAADSGGRLAATLLAVAVVTAVGLYLPAQPGDVGALAVAFGATWLLLVAVLAGGDRRGAYRPSAAYLMLFGLFHGGLIISVALLGPSAASDPPAMWLYNAHAVEAVKLAIIGMAAFALAAALVGGDRTMPAKPRRADEPALRRSFVVIGVGMELAGVLLFATTVITAGGLSLMAGGYDAFLKVAGANPGIGYATAGIGAGAVLAVVGGGRGRRIAWAVFLSYAAVAFPIGLRGEVLFGLLGLLAVEAHLGRRFRPVWTIAGSVLILVLVAVVRQTRTFGTGAELQSSSPLALVLEAVAEMGYSIRPTVVVLGWHSLNEPFMNGTTFFAVPMRLAERLLGVTPPEFDQRLFNVEIGSRVGAIGGSPLAEGYHNFGLTGVVCVMLALGVIVGILERQRSDALGAAVLGVVLIPLLTQVRNSFASVPADVAIGLLIVLGCWACTSAGRRQDPALSGNSR